MKKQLIPFALTILLLSGCGDTTDKQETTTVTPVTEHDTTATDSLSLEIESASDEVDSLLNDL